MAAKLQRDLDESKAALYEESQKVIRLQMELDAHESEVEQLQGKLALCNSDNMSVNSGPDLDGGTYLLPQLCRNVKQVTRRVVCIQILLDSLLLGSSLICRNVVFAPQSFSHLLSVLIVVVALHRRYLSVSTVTDHCCVLQRTV